MNKYKDYFLLNIVPWIGLRGKLPTQPDSGLLSNLNHALVVAY